MGSVSRGSGGQMGGAECGTVQLWAALSSTLPSACFLWAVRGPAQPGDLPSPALERGASSPAGARDQGQVSGYLVAGTRRRSDLPGVGLRPLSGHRCGTVWGLEAPYILLPLASQPLFADGVWLCEINPFLKAPTLHPLVSMPKPVDPTEGPTALRPPAAARRTMPTFTKSSHANVDG